MRWLGAIWIGGWVLVLAAVHRPWLDLGGVVPEALRWSVKASMAAGILAGLERGVAGREERYGARLADRWWNRWLPVAVAAALSACWLGLVQPDERLALVLPTWLSYWAGLDTGLLAWPLLGARGRRG